jgi:hypothetical protein
MKATPVDPRATRWEVVYPTYRVFIWTRLGPPPGPPLAQAWRSDEFDVADADVDDVLAWAKAKTPGDGTFTVWVLGENNGVPRLYRIAGWEPTRTMEEPRHYVRRAP